MNGATPTGNGQDEGRERAESARQFPSRLMANLFLLVGILTLILTSRPETDTLTRRAIGTAVEIGLALLAVLFMRVERLSVRETLRLRRPEGRSVLLALAAVPGLWMTGGLLNILSALTLGYTTPAPPAQFPRNAIEAIVLAAILIIVAPIFEEVMFRGYVQRAYERRSVWLGVVVGGLIFAIFHLRFQGVFAIVPVSLALGFVAWRTGSILTCVAMHAAHNTIGAILLISASFLPAQIAGGLTGALACLGLLFIPVSYVALWQLWRDTDPDQPRDVSQPRPLLRWAWILPLIAVIGIYSYASVTEVLVNGFPERVLDDEIALAPDEAWDEPLRWRYEVQNLLGQELGQATCTRRVSNERYILHCEAGYEGFDLTEDYPLLGDSLENLPLDTLPLGLSDLAFALRGEPKTWEATAAWSQPELRLETLEATEEGPGAGPIQLAFPGEERDATLTVRHADGDASTRLTFPAEQTLMPYEWAWRLSGLPFELPFGGDMALVHLNEEGEANLRQGFLEVAGGEPVWTPSGNHVTWKVTITFDENGRERTLAAWYESHAPYTLIRYDDGAVSYVLVSVEAVP